MTGIRRLYVYLVGFVALAMLVFGLSNLIRVMIEQVAGTVGSYLFISGEDLFRRQVSFFVATVVVALPVAAIHWLVAERWVAPTAPDAEAERLAGSRRVALGATVGLLGIAPVASAAWLLLDRVLLALLVGKGAVTVGGPIGTLLVSGLVWVVAWRVVMRDLGRSPALADKNRWFRLAVYAAATAGLALLVSGLFRLIDAAVRGVWQTPGIRTGGGPWWAGPVAGGIAAAVVGAALWASLWLWTARLAHRDDPVGLAERRSGLRFVAINATLTAAMVGTLAALAVPLEEGIKVLLGAPQRFGSAPPAAETVAAVARAVVLGAVWYAYAATARDQERLLGDKGNLRRLRDYLLAGSGLALWVAGLIRLLNALVMMAYDRNAPVLANNDRLFAVASGASLLVVGLAAWLVAWTRIERDVRADPAERSWVVRRGYLALAAGAGVLMLLGNLATALYGILTGLLGTAGDPWQRIAGASGWIVAGLFLALYHGAMIRQDARLNATLPASVSPAPPTPPAGTPPSRAARPVLLVTLPPGAPADAAAEAIRLALPGAVVEERAAVAPTGSA